MIGRMLFAASALVVLASSCLVPGLGKRDEASLTVEVLPPSFLMTQAPISAAMFTTFRTSCVGCHGAGQEPRFAVADPGDARAVIIAANLVTFDNVPVSRLVSKTRDGHCGSACQTDGSAMIDAIE